MDNFRDLLDDKLKENFDDTPIRYMKIGKDTIHKPTIDNLSDKNVDLGNYKDAEPFIVFTDRYVYQSGLYQDCCSVWDRFYIVSLPLKPTMIMDKEIKVIQAGD